MKFSVIIPSRNRPDALNKVVGSIGQQSYQDAFEIIVVDQSDQPSTPQAPPKGTFIYIKSETRGTSASKNIAIGKAHGEYIVQLDDDSTVSEDFLNRLNDLTEKYPDISCLCGLIKNTEDGRPFSRYMRDDCHNKTIGFYNFDCCLCAAMAIKRSAFDDIGLYDEELGSGRYFGSSEESDLVLRLLMKGHRVIYDCDFVSYHPSTNLQALTLCDWTKKHFSYGCGRGAMWRKYLRVKPLWSLSLWIVSIGAPLLMSVGMILTLQVRQSVRYFSSVCGRIIGFLKFR